MTTRRRAAAWGVALVVAIVVACVLSITVGARTIPWHDAWGALFHFDPDVQNQVVVHDLRLPRTVLALVVGGALALAGAVMQGLTRNPLADPGLLGVNAGAALAVVAALSVFGITAIGTQVWFALVGAAVAGGLVYGLGSMGRGGASPVKITIAGAAMAALLGSITSAVLLSDTTSLDRWRFWAVGSVTGRPLSVTGSVAPFLVAGAILALASARALNGLALGDDVARSLGQRVGWTRAAAAASVVLLAGGATAAAGPIWFVGLTIPHIVRAVTGPDHRLVLPGSVLAGAAFLTFADVIGRIVARPGELEIGIVCAALGAPVFIAFVRRRQLAEL